MLLINIRLPVFEGLIIFSDLRLSPSMFLVWGFQPALLWFVEMIGFKLLHTCYKHVFEDYLQMFLLFWEYLSLL